MFGISPFILVPMLMIIGVILGAALTKLVRLNNELAKARENEILNRDLMKKMQEELDSERKTRESMAIGSARDLELEMLIEKKRFQDAIDYIDERTRLAFEQGNSAREDMYRRYRENMEFELRDRSQDGF